MKIPGPRGSGEWFSTRQQRHCPHPRRAHRKRWLGRLPDGKGRMFKVWLVYCSRCGQGLRNKRRRIW